MDNHPLTTFIGAGNMAGSLIRGLLAAGHPASRLRAAEPDAARCAEISALGVAAGADNHSACQGAAVVVLAVKPQVLAAVLADLQPLLMTQQPLVLSIAAGISLDSLQRWCGHGVPVVRAMPNTPALLGQGVTALAAGNTVSPEQRSAAEAVAAAVGDALWVDDSDMDAVTAVSGSGPAWVFGLAEAMIDAGVNLGLARPVAERLAVGTVLGAGRMLTESGDNAAELRRKVTSPGGTTAAGLAAMAAAGYADAVAAGVHAAAARSAELALEMDPQLDPIADHGSGVQGS